MKKINKYLLALLIIICLHVLILLKSSFFPYPELVIYPYLTNIGLLPYKQILDQHFPGFMFFPLNLAVLGFTTPHSLKLLALLIVVILHLMLFVVSKKLFKSEKLAIAGNILLILFHPYLEGNVLWIDNFIPLLTLPVFYILADKLDSKRAFLAGFLLGIAVLLKQVFVPLAVLLALYVFFWRKKENISISFFAGAFVPAMALLVFLLQKGVLNDFLFWAGEFNFTAYAEMGRKYATFRQLVAIGVIYIPAILMATYALYKRIKKLSILSVIFLLSLLYAYARFDYVHLQPSLPFAILLVLYSFTKLPQRKVRTIIFLVYLLPVAWVASKYYKTQLSGEIKFFGPLEYEVAQRIESRTDKGDAIFMFGTLPHMYQLTETRPPGNVFVFHFPWFMKEAEDRILEGIVSDPPKVVVSQKSSSIDAMNLYSFMPKLEKYIDENYEKIDNVEDVEILVPKAHYENSN